MENNCSVKIVTCDMCGKKIDCYKNSFELRFNEPDDITNCRKRYSTFDFCSPECLSIYVLRNFSKDNLENIIKIER